MRSRALTTLALLVMTGMAWAQTPPKNVLVIMTDDQRWDTISKMPSLSAIAAQGVTFTNAFMPTPLCGPSRSMLFSGGYHSQNTGVLSNNPPNGGAMLFNDKANLGVVLQSAGYNTTFVGKWINGYEAMGKYVPPGWTHWAGRHSSATSTDWFKFQYVLGTSGEVSNNTGTIVSSNAYTTYYERDQVLNAINTAPTTQPFFILWTPTAPHTPATPAPEDVSLFSDYLYRDRSVGETDLKDKPLWVQKYNPATTGLGAYGVAYGDPFVVNQLRALQGVDRSIQAIVDALKANGQYDNTVIIFTADNGYEWAEHGLWAKSKPYEESVRVPLIVLMPGVAPRNDPNLVASSLDIGPTLFDIAGVSKQTEGMSLVPLLNDPTVAWRNRLFFEESDSFAAGNAIWAGSFDGNYYYAKYWTGEEELYDVNADPYELNSLHNNPDYAMIKANMASDTQSQLGLAILPVYNFKATKAGTGFGYQMKLWGGESAPTWSVKTGALPPGITVDAGTGLLHGVPTTPGTYSFSLQVLGSTLSPQTAMPRVFVTRVMSITIT